MRWLGFWSDVVCWDRSVSGSDAWERSRARATKRSLKERERDQSLAGPERRREEKGNRKRGITLIIRSAAWMEKACVTSRGIRRERSSTTRSKTRDQSEQKARKKNKNQQSGFGVQESGLSSYQQSSPSSSGCMSFSYCMILLASC